VTNLIDQEHEMFDAASDDPRSTATAEPPTRRVGVDPTVPGSRHALRVARPTRCLADVVAFYRDAGGLPVLAAWDDHDGFDGVVLALGDANRQLELLHHDDVIPAPSTEDQLVLYLGSSEAVASLTGRITAAGHQPRTSPNPYWQRDGAVCFVDPDGYWLVLSPSTWH
jgi:hypothetical protein